jgi:hypothetical protein
MNDPNGPVIATPGLDPGGSSQRPPHWPSVQLDRRVALLLAMTAEDI